jgi:hypothetical protein
VRKKASEPVVPASMKEESSGLVPLEIRLMQPPAFWQVPDPCASHS